MFELALYESYEVKRLFKVKTFFTAHDVIRPAGFKFSGEMHDFWECVYVAEGGINATADDRILELCEGSLLFHKPLEVHRLSTVGSTEAKLLILSFDAVGDGMLFFENKVFAIDSEKERRLYDIYSAVRDAQTESRNGRENIDYQQKTHKAANLTELFLLSLYNTREAEQTHTQSADSEDYKRIVRILRENCDRSLSLGEIAALCGMSVSSLKKKFSLFSDKGVMKYFGALKIKRALDMFHDGMDIVDISDRLSFSSINYFYSAFKRETGLTPGEYKKKFNI